MIVAPGTEPGPRGCGEVWPFALQSDGILLLLGEG